MTTLSRDLHHRVLVRFCQYFRRMCRCDDLPGDVVEHFDETALHVCVEEEIGLVEHNDFAVPKSVEVATTVGRSA